MINLLKLLSSRNIPRWVIYQIDISLSLLSFLFAWGVLNNLNLLNKTNSLFILLAFVFSWRTIGFIILKSYSGIIKFTSHKDAIRVFFAVSIGSFGLLLIDAIRFIQGTEVLFGIAIIMIDFFVTLSLLTSFRLAAKIFYRSFILKNNLKKRKVIIFGAGEAASLTKRALYTDINNDYRVVAFYDDNPKLEGKMLDGVKIYSEKKGLEALIDQWQPHEIIIAIPSLKGQRKKEVIDLCLRKNVIVKDIPPVVYWAQGELTARQIKNVNIEDLLGREPINIENESIKKYIQGKVILITGAAGSIGSEIARQCINYNPQKLILLDQAETPLHDLQYEFKNAPNIEIIVADVTNERRMEKVFKFRKPEIIFHAAAYKHVPLMEDNPYEAIYTNVFGTKVVANLAVKYETEKFVFISTDKAVNPTNIMGASKRIAETYVQSLNAKLSLSHDNHTKFVTTRFGNVLGSNGSVIPRFKEQIDLGGPVTVTHPEITRYFMTIPEACQLVLEAGSIGQGGEIYVFDMGKSVKILDLARKMIKLSGLEPGKDIKIIFSGLRPGEKLKEELLSDQENTIPTHNPKIMIAKVRSYNFLKVNQQIEMLFTEKSAVDNDFLVKIMKQLVPEYLSNNSIYQEIDKQMLK